MKNTEKNVAELLTLLDGKHEQELNSFEYAHMLLELPREQVTMEQFNTLYKSVEAKLDDTAVVDGKEDALTTYHKDEINKKLDILGDWVNNKLDKPDHQED